MNRYKIIIGIHGITGLCRRPSKVIDMHDNTVIAECADGIELTMKIGETRWFQLLPVK